MVAKKFLDPEGVPSFDPDKGNPSTTINGSLLADNEDPPLIRIAEPEAGPPPVEIWTPATLPFNKFSTVGVAPLLNSFEVICVTEPVASFFSLFHIQ